MEEIRPGIVRSRVPSVTLPPYRTTECYWVGDKHEVVLIDTGDGQPSGVAQLEADWEGLGSPAVRAVFATHHHADHTGGGRWAHERFGAPIYLNGRDQAGVMQRGDDTTPWQPYDENRLTVGGLTIHLLEAPGHTPGQWNFWIPERQGLLAGDNVLGNTTVVIVPPDGHLGDYLRTLEQLSRLGAEWIGPGHGDIVPNAGAYLAEYLAHRRQRGEEILGLLCGQRLTPRAIAEAIYRGKLSPETMAVGEWMVQGHLAYFVEMGTVREEQGTFMMTEERP